MRSPVQPWVELLIALGILFFGAIMLRFPRAFSTLPRQRGESNPLALVVGACFVLVGLFVFGQAILRLTGVL